jgi:hypothetical protein
MVLYAVNGCMTALRVGGCVTLSECVRVCVCVTHKVCASPVWSDAALVSKGAQELQRWDDAANFYTFTFISVHDTYECGPLRSRGDRLTRGKDTTGRAHRPSNVNVMSMLLAGMALI